MGTGSSRKKKLNLTSLSTGPERRMKRSAKSDDIDISASSKKQQHAVNRVRPQHSNRMHDSRDCPGILHDEQESQRASS